MPYDTLLSTHFRLSARFLLFACLVVAAFVSTRAFAGGNAKSANPTDITLRNSVTVVTAPSHKAFFSMPRAQFILMSFSSSLRISPHCSSIRLSNAAILESTCPFTLSVMLRGGRRISNLCKLNEIIIFLTYVYRTM